MKSLAREADISRFGYFASERRRSSLLNIDKSDL